MNLSFFFFLTNPISVLTNYILNLIAHYVLFVKHYYLMELLIY